MAKYYLERKEINKNAPAWSKRIDKYLNETKYTQDEFAKICGISTGTMSSLLYGTKSKDGYHKFPFPRVATIMIIADKMKVSTDYLLGRTDNATVNEDIKTACKITGLCEDAVSTLSLKQEWSDGFIQEEWVYPTKYALDVLLTNNNFYSLVNSIFTLISNTYAEIKQKEFFINNKTEFEAFDNIDKYFYSKNFNIDFPFDVNSTRYFPYSKSITFNSKYDLFLTQEFLSDLIKDILEHLNEYPQLKYYNHKEIIDNLENSLVLFKKAQQTPEYQNIKQDKNTVNHINHIANQNKSRRDLLDLMPKVEKSRNLNM